jgi:hypothetical protein
VSVILNNRYRELDQREEDLKRELEIVRAQKRDITQQIFLVKPIVPASSEALPSADANSRVPDGEAQETQEDRSRSELPTREPIIRQHILP